MYAIWALTAQSIMVLIAYGTACLAAATFATAAITKVTLTELQTSWEALIQTTVLIVSMTFSLSVSAFLPAAIGVALTEGLKLRGLVSYLVIGSAIGLTHALPIREAIYGMPLPPILNEVVVLCVACGAVGGLVYWAIAGRTAGRWLDLPWFAEFPR
ncbi:hypothetical protein [Acuticoccus kandeliae]|uniref:hypothetical protein n=1 Tax=Acuticoccus kandeliae TaxID=2073160 RepID=UPI001300BDEF|nr:hypothetical protein [Acuticoccus kandeliae]